MNFTPVSSTIIQPTMTPTSLFSSAIQVLQNDLLSNIMTAINMDKSRKENILMISICQLVDKVAMNDALLNKFIDKEEKSQEHNEHMMHSIEKRLINIERSLQTLQTCMTNKQDIDALNKTINTTLDKKLTNKLKQSLQQYSVNHQNMHNKINDNIASIQMDLKHITKDSVNNTNQLNIINEQMRNIPRTSSLTRKFNKLVDGINTKIDDANKQTQKQIRKMNKQIDVQGIELQEGLLSHSIAMQSMKDQLKSNHIKSTPRTETATNYVSTPRPTRLTPLVDIVPSTTITPKSIHNTANTPSANDLQNKNDILNGQNQPNEIIINNKNNETNNNYKLIEYKSMEHMNRIKNNENITNEPTTIIEQPTLTINPKLTTNTKSIITTGTFANIDTLSDSAATSFEAPPPDTPTSKTKFHIAPTPNENATISQSSTAETDLFENTITELKNQLYSYLKSFHKTTTYRSNTQVAQTPYKLGLRWFHEDDPSYYDRIRSLTACQKGTKLLQTMQFGMDHFSGRKIKINFSGYTIGTNLKSLARNPFSTAHIIPPKEAINKASNYKRGGNELWEEQEYDYSYDSYLSAIQLDPTNVIYKLNAAAAALKLEDYERTLHWCQDAVLYAKDAQNICKAYRRMGIAEESNGNIAKCIEYFEKAQSAQFDSKLKKKIKSLKNKLNK